MHKLSKASLSIWIKYVKVKTIYKDTDSIKLALLRVISKSYSGHYGLLESLDLKHREFYYCNYIPVHTSLV